MKLQLPARVLLALSAATSVHAAYPAPWPDAPGNDPARDWRAYGVAGLPIHDPATSSNGGPGDDTAGASPTGAQDISSGVPDGSSPSAYWAFDGDDGVFYYRIRVAKSPLTSGVERDGVVDAANAGNGPWSPGTWNLTIDVDGDGYKEFAVLIDGNSGGGSADLLADSATFATPAGVRFHPGDDLLIYRADRPSQDMTPHDVSGGAIAVANDLVWAGETATKVTAGPPGGRATNGFAYDFGPTRAVYYENDATYGTGWMVDVQLPITALRESWSDTARLLVTSRTPIQFGYSTANSNTDPFQKDVALGGAFQASPTERYAFGDVVTMSQGVRTKPMTGRLQVVSEDCGSRLKLRAPVIDALRANSGNVAGRNAMPAVVDTIAQVSIEEHDDLECDGRAPAGAVWTGLTTVAGSLNPDTDGTADIDGAVDATANFNDWGVSADITGLSDGCHLLKLVARDDEGNEQEQVGLLYRVDRGAGCVFMSLANLASYSDTLRTIGQDLFLADGSTTAYFGGTGYELDAQHVIAFYGPDDRLALETSAVSDSLGSLEFELPIATTTALGGWRVQVLAEGSTAAITRDPSATGLIREDAFTVTTAADADRDGLPDDVEIAAGSNPNDADSDDDGLLDGADGTRDSDGDGVIDSLDPDSDDDGLVDGLEAGIAVAGPDTDLSRGIFVVDLDPATTTDPDNPDTDFGGVLDGAEDRDANGRVDPGERSPIAGQGADDVSATCSAAPLFEVDGDPTYGLRLRKAGTHVALQWSDEVGTRDATCIVYRVHAADDVTPSTRAAFSTRVTTSANAWLDWRAIGDGTSLRSYVVTAYSLNAGEGSWGYGNDGHVPFAR